MKPSRKWRFLVIAAILGFTVLRSVASSSSVDLSPASLKFGSQTVGTTSGPGAVTVTNHLNTPVTITNIAVNGDFAETNNCAAMLAPGQGCTIKVTFTPTASGARNGQLIVTDDSGSGPQIVSLSGTGSVAGLSSLSVMPASVSVPLGLNQQFTATGYFKNGNVANLTASAVWSSSNTSVATVSNATGSQGQAASRAQGTTMITALVGSVSGSSSLTVVRPAPVSLTIAPANPVVLFGTTQQFTAIESLTDGSTQDATQLVNWSSSNSTVSSIGNSVGIQGLAKALALGTTTITATLGTLTASTTLTVNEPLRIFITPNPTSLFLGKTVQFSAIGVLSDGITTRDLTTSAKWSSSNIACATISNSPGSQGLATGVTQGTATITAVVVDAFGGHFSANSFLVVQAPSVVSLTIKPQNPSVQVGAISQLTASGNFDDGSTMDLTQSVLWTSSRTGVAVVGNDAGIKGLITGGSEGTTTITAVLNPSSPIARSTVLAVSSQPVSSIAVRPAFVSIPLGDDQQFTATSNLPDGSSQDLTGTVTWSSSDTGVATISNAPGTAGRVTSLALGTTTITASNGTDTSSTTLSIVPPVPGQARFAYVTKFRDATISMYRLDAATGLLTSNGNDLDEGGTRSLAIAPDASGNFIYTANRDAGTISVHSVDPRAGLLTPTGAQVSAILPWALAADPSGKFLFVANGPGSVSTYAIGPNGALSFVAQTAQAPGGAISVAVHPSGKFVYSANVNANSISAYRLDPATGTLTSIPGSPFPTGANPQSVSIDPTGRFLYAPNGNGQSVSGFLIDTTGGGLSTMPASPFPVGIIPMWVALDPSTKFAFVTNQADNTVSAFDVNSVTGGLQAAPGSPFSDRVGFGPTQAIVDPLGLDAQCCQ